MAIDHQAEIEALRKTFQQISSVSNPEGLRERIAELTEASAAPGLWDDQDKAQSVTSKLSHAQAELDRINAMSAALDDLETLKEMADEGAGSGPETAAELYPDLEREFGQVGADVPELKIRTLLSGKYDECGTVITICSGTGGADAADFAQILQRVYLRWAERRGYGAKVLDTSYTEGAGIKSTTFEVSAPYAYGTLSVEAGTHRLVRISPLDSQGGRQTSFAAVEVTPLIRQTDHIDAPEAGIRVDVFRSSGPGGQSVDTTDSAVRITHIPAGIVVSMQDEKSQVQSRAATMRMLQSCLLFLEQEEEAREKKELAGDIEASWGNQMRSYVLRPYQMVKDLRAGHEAGSPGAVFDGDIDGFIDAGTRWQATGVKAGEGE